MISYGQKMTSVTGYGHIRKFAKFLVMHMVRILVRVRDRVLVRVRVTVSVYGYGFDLSFRYI